MPDLTPAQVADLDQRHAALTEAYEGIRAAVAPVAAEEGEEYATAELYEDLAESDWTREDLAALAAIAIVRTTNQEGTPQCP